jgi:hypothetical protein
MVRFARALVLFIAAACARPSIAPTPVASQSLVPAGASLLGEVQLHQLAVSSLLQEDLLARQRDRALARFGLRATDLLRATGNGVIFALPSGAMAAHVPGLFLDGRPARRHRGFDLVARGEQVAARIPGGTLIGDPSAVGAALDVLEGTAPPLGDSTLRQLVDAGSSFRTIRVATVQPELIFDLLPAGPPAGLRGRVASAALYATLEGTYLTARLAVRGRDRSAARDVATWADRELRRLRSILASWREGAGIFGSALEPAISALDAVSVQTSDGAAQVAVQADLGPIFSSGLLTVLRTLQLLSP